MQGFDKPQFLRALPTELSGQRGRFHRMPRTTGAKRAPGDKTPTYKDALLYLKPSARGSISSDLDTIAVPSAGRWRLRLYQRAGLSVRRREVMSPHGIVPCHCRCEREEKQRQIEPRLSALLYEPSGFPPYPNNCAAPQKKNQKLAE